jgi:hypothetical protein
MAWYVIFSLCSETKNKIMSKKPESSESSRDASPSSTSSSGSTASSAKKHDLSDLAAETTAKVEEFLTQQKTELLSHIDRLVDRLETKKKELIAPTFPYKDKPERIAASVCPDLKLPYEICMQKWYNEKFLALKHDPARDAMPCETEFDVYQSCVHTWLEGSGMDHVHDIQFHYNENDSSGMTFKTDYGGGSDE